MASRTENSTRNLVFAVSGHILLILLTFISRTVFIRTLGSTYLGINGLFANIISFLNLAELGLGSSISFSLYKPLMDNDTARIASIMQFYKKIYRVIGIFILALGFAIAPIVRFFITSDTEVMYVEFYFALYVINAGVSYFFSYKRTLISADQRHYINTIFKYGFLIAQTGVQVVLLYITRSFAAFLIIEICSTVIQNIAVAAKADRMYPYLKNKNVDKISAEDLGTIKKNVGAMVVHKIGTACVTSTDNILISKMINIVVVGIYSNYLIVISAIEQLIGQFFVAIVASVGNLGAENDKRVMRSAFDRIFFINFWMCAFSVICCACLFQPFVALWVGNDMLLSVPILAVVLFNFYLNAMRKTVLVFRESLGLFWYDRYKPVAEAVINLVVSAVLALKFGLIGIFIGTTVSCVSTSLWIEPFILCRYAFKNEYLNLSVYFRKFFGYTVIAADLAVCLFVTGLIPIGGVAGLVIKALVSITLSNLILIAVFFRTENFRWLSETLKQMLRKIRSGKSTAKRI